MAAGVSCRKSQQVPPIGPMIAAALETADRNRLVKRCEDVIAGLGEWVKDLKELDAWVSEPDAEYGWAGYKTRQHYSEAQESLQASIALRKQWQHLKKLVA